MKTIVLMVVSLILLALGMFCATFAPTCRAGESNAVETIRLSLRQQGFKIDLSEFDFTVPKEVQARSAAVCTDGKVNPQRPVSFLEDNDLLTPVGDHAAVVVWNQEALAYPRRGSGPDWARNFAGLSVRRGSEFFT